MIIINEHISPDLAEGQWFKSSYSAEGGNDCVEVCPQPGAIRVRDSKQNDGDIVGFGGESWATLVDWLKV